MANNYFGITDKGKMRKNNEDTFIAQRVLNNQFIAACVIDGVGGYEGGEIAAQLAHDEILKVLNGAKKEDDVIPILVEAFSSANEKIYNERKENKDNNQMACVLTLALVDVANNKFFYAHVGDTRLYLFRDSLVKVSRDHSFVGFLEDSGRLSEEAAMRHPKRNEINRALGFDTQIASKDYIETGESPFLPGDMLLLCSDGLTDMVNNKLITDILIANTTLEQKGKALVTAANDGGGKDNITVVLALNDKEPIKQQATKPVISAKKDVVEDTSTKLVSAEKEIVADTKKSKSSVPVLKFLCIILFLTTLWLLYKTFWAEDARPDSPAVVERVTEKKEKNIQEQIFLTSLSDSNDQVVINDTLSSINISDSILISKDSVHIVGNGVTLINNDSKGPAFVISPTCNYFLLDGVTLQNFDIGILLQREVLHLKNVQFINCRIPIQYQLLFPNNTVLNGRIADSIFYNNKVTDSL